MAKARPITGIDARATTAQNAYRIARTRLEEVMEWGQYADEPERVGQLHNLRIAAKRLRYTLEIFADVLPPESSSMLDEMTKVQEELGSLHDTDVMIALVRHCLKPVESQNDSDTPSEQQADGGQEEITVSHTLLASLLDARGTLTSKERRGLEELEQMLHHRRDDYYKMFRQHWHQLEAHNFSKALSDQLEM